MCVVVLKGGLFVDDLSGTDYLSPKDKNDYESGRL
jgi:hypothetical protein